MKLAILVSFAAAAFAQTANHDLGYKDTPILPGLPYHVHDSDRPRPKAIKPGAQAGAAPSDAIVLFDGKDLSHWVTEKDGSPAKWKVESGYMEVVKGAGQIASREKFG